MNDAYFAQMHREAAKRLGRVAYDITRTIFDADGFRWRDDATRTAIARHFREVPNGTGFADCIT